MCMMRKKTAYNKALDLLAIQDYSKDKLTKKLLKNGYELHEVNHVMETLEKNSLLNERRMSECKIKSLIQKGYGPEFIRQSLDNNHLQYDECQIEEAYETVGINADQQIAQLLEKKFKHAKDWDLTDDSGYKTKQKILRFLLSKGHDPEKCEEAVSMWHSK